MSIMTFLTTPVTQLFKKEEIMVDATVVTLGQAIDAKLAAAREKVATLEAAVHADLEAAKADVAKLEADMAAIPAELKAFAHDDIIAKIEEFFK